jgi:4-amino-4-deoxy-L-arabinose transferase-like glycosyltransferase
MAVIPETAPAPASRAPRWRRFLTPWRSPPDQPAWARPALLAIAALAAVAYGWGMAGASVESFYGAAARSMSESWHDFIFGAFDPAGTVPIDKLPGELWVQALSLRIFGFHIWALVLPQVVEGVLTILVLYRAVRRLAGPAAGLTAAAVLAVTPITVLLSRGNVSDSLLILLLVLAADATSAALLTGSRRQLLLAGVWVGLAFQAKMIQAWLALPALAAAYLLAAPAARLRTRCAHVALAGLVTAVVSLSWMTAVSLVPSQDRPYVDGSADDSVYTQVFDYNGLGRLTGNWARIAGPPSPIVIAAVESGQSLTAETIGIKASWHRLLTGPFAADSGWLLPAAVAGALGVLISRRRQGRRDPLRAAVVLWGGWWLILAVFFSAGTYLNSYYVAALSPAVAALCGAGVAACGPRPWPARVRLIVAATVFACAGYGAYLISGAASGPVVLTAVALVVAAAAAAQLLLSRVRPGRAPDRRRVRRCRPVRHRHVRSRAELHPVQRQGGAADRRLPRQRAGPDAGHAAGRHQPRLRAGLLPAGVAAGPGPAGAVDRVALHQAAPAPEQPSGPVRVLLLRTPRRPAGRLTQRQHTAC